MPPVNNPLRLNALQLKTLSILQEMARARGEAAGDQDGAVLVGGFPPPHGDHYHVGGAVVMGRDATGLHNAAVFVALERKGLIRSFFPQGALVTKEGLAYRTGADAILHRAHH